MKSESYFVSTLNHTNSVVLPSLSVTFSSTVTVREYTPVYWLQTSSPVNWARLVLKLSILTNRQSRGHILRAFLIVKSIAKVCPSTNTNGQQVLHHAHDISIMDISLSLDVNTNSVVVRSLHHTNSIVHMYTNQVSIQRPPSGTVVDTGAQRSVTSRKSEILLYTNDSFVMSHRDLN